MWKAVWDITSANSANNFLTLNSYFRFWPIATNLTPRDEVRFQGQSPPLVTLKRTFRSASAEFKGIEAQMADLLALKEQLHSAQ